ncbi:hypothetical protein BSLG_006861 [Batrachochytrium salamandrivorans]|nr:hypothetical protein BSLG_006861 [Batrachochytrium salamandrivorans]
MDRSRLSSMPSVSRPFGQDKHLSKAASTSFRIHHDENAENRSSGYNGGDVRRGEIIKESSSDRNTFQRSFIPAGSDLNSNDSVEIRPAAGRPLPMHSTPYNYTRTGDIIQSESEASQGSSSTVSRARLILGQTLDPMTPITEASSDLDRTMGGLSTIRSCATTSGISTITEEVDDTMACRRRPLGSYRSVSSTESLGDTRRILSSCDDDDDNNHENYSGFTVQSDAEYHHSNPVADMHHQADQLQRLYLSNEDGDDHVDMHRDPIEVEGGHDTTGAGLYILDVPNPCDPYDKDIRQAILTQIAPLSMQETQPCYDHSDTAVDLPQNKVRGKYNDLHLDSVGTLNILGRLGEGGFGQVLLVQRELEQLGHVLNEADLADLLNDSFDGEDEMQDEGDASHVTLSEQIYALKIESPPSRWEHHMLCILASRLSPDVLESIIGCHSLHVYDNASMLLLPHCKYGSVIDCLNGASMRSYGVDGAGVNEALVAFWTIEMLRIVSALHSNGIVHGDIKADNLMLRFEVNSSGHSTSKPRSTNLQAQYQSDGSSGWDSKGLVMIDWGNSIDLRVFPSDHTFVTEVKERRAMGRGQGRAAQLDESIECFEVVASTVDAADPTADSVLSEFPILHLKRPFKRNWQTAIWTKLFDVLLNSGRYGAGKSSDCLTEINAIRTDLEEWLHTVSVRGSTMLRGLLSSVQASAMEKRRLPVR